MKKKKQLSPERLQWLREHAARMRNKKREMEAVAPSLRETNLGGSTHDHDPPKRQKEPASTGSPAQTKSMTMTKKEQLRKYYDTPPVRPNQADWRMLMGTDGLCYFERPENQDEPNPHWNDRSWNELTQEERDAHQFWMKSQDADWKAKNVQESKRSR